MVFRKSVHLWFCMSIQAVVWLCTAGCHITDLMDNPTKWKKMNPGGAAEVTIHAFAAGEDNLVVVSGYDEIEQDCGFMGLGRCRPYKLFQSLDGGDSWTEIIDPIISVRHSFLKGDKLNPRLIGRISRTYGTALKVGKYIYDYAAYTDFRAKGRLFYAGGGNLYLYVDYELYRSNNLGRTWIPVSVKPNHIFGDDVEMEMIGDYLLCFDRREYKKYTFRRVGNAFVKSGVQDFAVVHQGGEKSLLFSDGGNLASRYYYDAKSNIMRRATSGDEANRLSFAKAYILNDKTIYANFSFFDGAGKHLIYTPLVSYDGGETFERVQIKFYHPLFFNRPPTSQEIVGISGDLLVVGLDFNKADVDAGPVNVRYGKRSYALLKHDGLYPFPFSREVNLGGFFVPTFGSTQKYFYTASNQGLFRTNNLDVDVVQ
jgi:hypothetical protein